MQLLDFFLGLRESVGEILVELVFGRLHNNRCLSPDSFLEVLEVLLESKFHNGRFKLFVVFFDFADAVKKLLDLRIEFLDISERFSYIVDIDLGSKQLFSVWPQAKDCVAS